MKSKEIFVKLLFKLTFAIIKENSIKREDLEQKLNYIVNEVKKLEAMLNKK